MEANNSARKSSLTTTGNTKLFNSLFLWMSAKKLLITTRNRNRLSPKPHVRDWNRYRSSSRPQESLPVSRVIQYKILVHRPIGIVTPVAEQVLAEKALFSCRGFQEACRNNLVGIHILQRKRHTCTCYDIEFLFHSSITLMFADRLSLLSRLRLRPPTDWPTPYAHRDLDVLQNYD